MERNENFESESKAAAELREQVFDLEHKYNESSTKLREIQVGLMDKEKIFVRFFFLFPLNLSQSGH